jgi:accessory gene regulator B
MRITLTKHSVAVLIKEEIIQQSDEELYQFGINQLFLFLLNIATTVIIGAVFGMLWQSILFSASYIPLRRYAGGYHAKTPRRCYCLSVLLIMGVLFILKYIPFSQLGMIIVLTVSFTVIYVKSPIESENKPLSDAERTLYQIKARRILLAETALAILLCILLCMVQAECIIMAVCCSAAMLVIRYNLKA